MKALQGSCAQPYSRHHSSTGHNTVGCLYWRDDHELDCVLQTKGEPLSDPASPGCMKNRLCKLHNAPGCSQQCHGRPTGLALGQGGSWISSLPPSQHGKAQESCCVGKKKPLTYLLGKSCPALEWRLMHRAVVMDQREPGMVARCSAELQEASRKGNRRDVTLVLVCLSHPCPSAHAHHVHWDSALQFWSVPVHFDKKLPKEQVNSANTKPVYKEDPISQSTEEV